MKTAQWPEYTLSQVERSTLTISNAEKQVAALAAEVQAVRWAAGQVYSAGYNHGHLNTADELPYASDEELLQRGNEVLIEFTDPDHSGNVTDAVLDEVRTHAIKSALNECSECLDRDCIMDSNGISYEDAALREAGAMALHDALLRQERAV
ncbi:hypothetical protein [Enterobacter cloacae]|uniref:hypothetical protein n=1 Tax=Enterobacter cloacae TaxID=550 RepID=UPI0033506560